MEKKYIAPSMEIVNIDVEETVLAASGGIPFIMDDDWDEDDEQY